jgi:threonine/homoserine/homoserine lactone efflux protein
VIDATQAALFAVAAGALVMAPGPDMLLVLGRALGQGRISGTLAAFLAALGCATGIVVLSALVALGLVAVLQTSALAFGAMKFAGAIYLVYLGIRTLRDKALFAPKPAKPASPLEIFSLSLAGNLVNPKVALFMFAFLPQFVDHGANTGAVIDAGVTAQIMVLGCIYALLTIVIYTALGAMAAALSNTLARRPRVLRGLNVGAGIVFLLSGLKIATFEQPR